MKKGILFIAAMLIAVGLNAQSFIYNEYDNIDGQTAYTNAILEAEDGGLLMSMTFWEKSATGEKTSRIYKMDKDGKLLESEYIEFYEGEHRGFYPFFRHPELAGMNMYVYFTYGTPTYYNAVVFDDGLGIYDQISTPMPYSDIQSRDMVYNNTEHCILDSENNIIVMKRIDESQNFIFVKMDLNGNILSKNEVKVDMEPNGWTFPYHSLTVYNESPLQYAFAFTRKTVLDKLCVVVLDSEFNVIDTDFSNASDIYSDNERINLLGYDNESYLTSSMHFSGGPISWSINLRKMNKNHEVVNEYEYRGYSQENGNDPKPHLYTKNIVTTKEGNIYWIYSLARKAFDGYDLHVSYFDKDLNLLWERMAAEYVGHHSSVMSAAVRDDGSLILCGGKSTGEIFSLVMDNSGYPLNVDEQVNNATYSIYPNPASDYIKLSAISSQQSVVKIYNALGMLVDEYEMNSSEIEINVSDYNSGIYFIDIDGVMNKLVIR